MSRPIFFVAQARYHGPASITVLDESQHFDTFVAAWNHLRKHRRRGHQIMREDVDTVTLYVGY